MPAHSIRVRQADSITPLEAHSSFARWLRGKGPPLLVLAWIFGLGCRSVPPGFDAQIVNQSSKPVTVEYRGERDGRDRERVSLQLAPGGTFRRELWGCNLKAGAKVSGGDMPYGPIEFGFSQQWPRYLVLDDGAGVRVERQPAEPRKPEPNPDPEPPPELNPEPQPASGSEPEPSP